MNNLDNEEYKIFKTNCKCEYRCTCKYNTHSDLDFSEFYNTINRYCNTIIAGAKLKKIDQTKKIELDKDKKIITLDLADNLLEDLINQANFNIASIKEYDLLSFIKKKLSEKDLNYISGDKIEILCDYIKKNIQLQYNKKCINSLPLFYGLTTNKNFEHDLSKNIPFFNNYYTLINQSINQSREYKSIDMINNIDFNKNLDFGNYSQLADPVVIALFLSKLSILETLVIDNDSLELYSNIKESTLKNIYNFNMELFNYRSTDPNLYGYEITTYESEMLRILAHILLRIIIINIRQGKFNNEINVKFNTLINNLKIKYNGYTSTPKGKLESILRIFSFKPTYIVESEPLTNGGIREKYDYYYPYQFDNSNNGVIMYRQINPFIINSNYPLTTINSPQFLINNMYKDNKFSILQNSQCPIFIKKPKITNLISSSGIFVMDVDRINNSIRGIINFNNRPIDLANTLMINNQSFKLVSSVLYKTPSNTCGLRIINNSYNMYTLVNLNNGQWFRYDPSYFSNNDSLKNLKNKEVLNYINKIRKFKGNDKYDNLTKENLEQFISEDPVTNTLALKNIENESKFSSDSFLIDESIAISEITTNSVLLIYSTDYQPKICLIPEDNNIFNY